MRNIKRKRNYSTYVIVACICVLSAMGAGYGGLFLYREAYYNNMIGARPVVFLRSSIQIMGGNGTKENPYTIV